MMRIALTGLGAAARNLHLPAYAQLKGRLQLVAGCDTDAAARAQCRSHLPEIYANLEEMIVKTEPDLVAICTPPALHHEQTLLALNYGCHVFCEKPLAEDLAQADEIISAAERARRLVVVNTQFPSMRIYQASKAMIGSPEFGRLLFLQAWQTYHYGEVVETKWRAEMERRLCCEFGVHVFELIRFFFDDEPVNVFAHMPRPLAEVKADLINLISLEFADGRAASIILNKLSRGQRRYLDLRLDGESASIQTSIGGEIQVEMGIHTRKRRPFLNFNLVKGGKAVLQNGDRREIIASNGINPFASATAAHLRDFIEAIRRGSVPRGAAKDNRNTLALALAACESAESGRAVNLQNWLEMTRHAKDDSQHGADDAMALKLRSN